MGSHYKGPEKERAALSAFINLMRASDSVVSMLFNHPGLKHGLSPSQFGTLETLWHLGPMCQRELSRKLLKSSGNVTLVVDNLEKRGLVERRPHPSDRRMTTLHLTAKGEALIKGLFPRHARATAELMGVLTTGEQETLRRLCRKLGRQEA